MDDKTEELRDLFQAVSDTDVVTEGQEQSRGTLTDRDEETVERKLQAIIEQMRERFSFETALSDDQRATVIRAFYRGESDAEMADRLSIDEETGVQARLELHLFRESDMPASIDWDRLRRRLTNCDDDASVAEELDLDKREITRYRRVLAAREEARRVSYRFQSAFRDVIPDANLADRLTADVTEDGLEEAAEDIETDVSF